MSKFLTVNKQKLKMYDSLKETIIPIDVAVFHLPPKVKERKTFNPN